jgi:hypothetical protein
VTARRFRQCVAATAGLESACRSGIEALRKADRRRISCDDTRRLAGSVDVDAALRDALPDDHRWDYAIGVVGGPSRDDRVHWIEVHPANSTHVDEVIAKRRWLQRWLQSVKSSLRRLPATYVWVASGAVALSPNSPQRKRIAKAGIRFSGSRYEIPLD